MIRLPSGPATSAAATGTGGSNTPTTNTAPSQVTQAVGSQPMQIVTSNNQSSTAVVQQFSGPGGSSNIMPHNTNTGNVSISSQPIQQHTGNSISGNSNSSNKNGFTRPAPSQAPGQTQSNVPQQTSTGKEVLYILCATAKYISFYFIHTYMFVFIILYVTVSPYQVLMPSGHPPPTMAGNPHTSINQTVTSMPGGVTVMPGQGVPSHAAGAGQAAVASVGNMMSLSMPTSSPMPNNPTYQFPITAHPSASNIQPTPGYPGNAAQTIIYVS